MTWGEAGRPQVDEVGRVAATPVVAPVNATHRPMMRRWAQLAVLLVGFGLSALVLAAAIGLEAGVQASLLGLVLAALPLGLVVPAFLWLDRFEAEPTRLLAFAFGWGALVASAGALVLNTSSVLLLRQVGQDPLTVASVGIAPVVEETLKGTAVLLILVFRRREFDGIVDGMVYAGICAAGFAFAENVLYLGRAFSEGGSDGPGGGLPPARRHRPVRPPAVHPLHRDRPGLAATTRRCPAGRRTPRRAAAGDRAARDVEPVRGCRAQRLPHRSTRSSSCRSSPASSRWRSGPAVARAA